MSPKYVLGGTETNDQRQIIIFLRVIGNAGKDIGK